MVAEEEEAREGFAAQVVEVEVEVEHHVIRALCRGHVTAVVEGPMRECHVVQVQLVLTIPITPLVPGHVVNLEARDRGHVRRLHGRLDTVRYQRSETGELGPWSICDERHGIRFRR